MGYSGAISLTLYELTNLPKINNLFINSIINYVKSNKFPENNEELFLRRKGFISPDKSIKEPYEYLEDKQELRIYYKLEWYNIPKSQEVSFESLMKNNKAIFLSTIKEFQIETRIIGIVLRFKEKIMEINDRLRPLVKRADIWSSKRWIKDFEEDLKNFSSQNHFSFKNIEMIENINKFLTFLAYSIQTYHGDFNALLDKFGIKESSSIKNITMVSGSQVNWKGLKGSSSNIKQKGQDKLLEDSIFSNTAAMLEGALSTIIVRIPYESKNFDVLIRDDGTLIFRQLIRILRVKNDYSNTTNILDVIRSLYNQLFHLYEISKRLEEYISDEFETWRAQQGKTALRGIIGILINNFGFNEKGILDIVNATLKSRLDHFNY